MEIAFSDILATLGSAFLGLLGRMFWGSLIGVVASLATHRFLSKPSCAPKEGGLVGEYLEQDTRYRRRLYRVILLIVGFGCGLIAGTAAGVRHVYRITVEDCPAVQSRIESGAEMLADFVFVLDNTTNDRGDLETRLEQWRNEDSRLRPSDLCTRIRSASDSIDKKVQQALSKLPTETAVLTSRFLPIDTLNETVESTFGSRINDSMTRKEVAKSINKSLIEDGLTAAVTRKTNTYILVSVLMFALTSGAIAWDLRRNFSA